MSEEIVGYHRFAYGIVAIVSGTHAGKVGWYDDEHWSWSIVFFGTPYSTRAHGIRFRDIGEATEAQKQEFTKQYLAHLPHDFRERRRAEEEKREYDLMRPTRNATTLHPATRDANGNLGPFQPADNWYTPPEQRTPPAPVEKQQTKRVRLLRARPHATVRRRLPPL